MRFTRMSRLAAAASLTLAGLVALVASSAAAPYPPQPGAPPTGVLGVRVGGTIAVSICGFAPGTAVAVTVDGQSIGSVTAGNTACVTVTLTITSTTTAQVGGLALGTPSSGAKYNFASYQTVSQGRIFSFADGLQAVGGTIAITCGSNSVVGTGTGANGSPTTASSSFSVICATASSGIVFTGSNSIRDLEVGGGLFLIGALIVIAFRRHEHRRA